MDFTRVLIGCASSLIRLSERFKFRFTKRPREIHEKTESGVSASVPLSCIGRRLASDSSFSVWIRVGFFFCLFNARGTTSMTMNLQRPQRNDHPTCPLSPSLAQNGKSAKPASLPRRRRNTSHVFTALPPSAFLLPIPIPSYVLSILSLSLSLSLSLFFCTESGPFVVLVKVKALVGGRLLQCVRTAAWSIAEGNALSRMSPRWNDKLTVDWFVVCWPFSFSSSSSSSLSPSWAS